MNISVWLYRLLLKKLFISDKYYSYKIQWFTRKHIIIQIAIYYWWEKKKNLLIIYYFTGWFICWMQLLICQALRLKRLNDEPERKRGLAEEQFTFRQGISNIYVLVIIGTHNFREIRAIIITDVKNVFNCLPHKTVMKELNIKRVKSYLNRMLAVYLKSRTYAAERHYYQGVI